MSEGPWIVRDDDKGNGTTYIACWFIDSTGEASGLWTREQRQAARFDDWRLAKLVSSDYRRRASPAARQGTGVLMASSNMSKGRKRKVKPKTLLLSTGSDRSIARVMAALAFTSSSEVVLEHQLRSRAFNIIELLRRIS